MLRSLGFAAGTLALLLVAWRAFRRGRPTDGPRNPARGLAETGEVLGVFLVAASAASGCPRGDDLVADAARTAVFALSGLAAFLVAGRSGVALLLRGRLASEIADGNAAAGVVDGAHVAATAFVASRLFFGDSYAALGPACLFFVVGQATLHLLVLLFRALTTYDDVEQVLDENLAAAVSYGGVTLAVGLLVAHAADGPYVGLVESLEKYCVALLCGLVLYPVRQILVQSVILGARPTLRGGPLDDVVARGRDVGMGALEACTYVATALTVGALA